MMWILKLYILVLVQNLQIAKIGLASFVFNIYLCDRYRCDRRVLPSDRDYVNVDSDLLNDHGLLHRHLRPHVEEIVIWIDHAVVSINISAVPVK